MTEPPLLAQRCQWCRAPAPYNEGTRCYHPVPPVECRVHGKQTDLNLVARGRRAVVKCTHYGNAWVVLFADPIDDEKEHGTYTIQFAMVGAGQEVYKIPPLRGQCPHEVYDKLVREMQGGARPSANRIPDPSTRSTQPGKELQDG